MHLRLDPQLSVVWRDPSTVQVGVDRPTAVLHDVDRVDERILGVLRRGVGGGPRALAVLADAGPSRVSARLADLAPALLADAPAPPPVVDVVGRGGVADALVDLARASGLAVRGVDPDDDDPVRAPLAALVAEHVLAPRDALRWVRHDVPHLLVRRGDGLCEIGPLVRPGTTACSRCLDLHRTDADPGWPAVAAQLWRRPAPPLDALVLAQAVLLAVRRLVASAGTGGDGRQVPDGLVQRVADGDGRISVAPTRPHPACGCAAPPGTGSGDAPRLVPVPSCSTRAAVVGAPA